MARAVHDTSTMKTSERFRFVLIVGTVVALLTAGISLAGDALDPSHEPEPTTCEPVDDGVTPVDEITPDEERVVEDGDDPADAFGDTDDCDDDAAVDDPAVEEEADVGDDASQDDVTQEFVPQDCTAAIDVDFADAPTEGPTPGEHTGLENAMDHVMWNCLVHPNHGLVNALAHLKGNLDQKLLRDEAREQRRAEREAAKAEREASRDAAKAEREAAKAEREHGHGS